MQYISSSKIKTPFHSLQYLLFFTSNYISSKCEFREVKLLAYVTPCVQLVFSGFFPDGNLLLNEVLFTLFFCMAQIHPVFKFPYVASCNFLSWRQLFSYFGRKIYSFIWVRMIRGKDSYFGAWSFVFSWV